MQKASMKIGELATASGTSVDTIRYDERQGRLPAPARTACNYRQYDAAKLQRLQFVRHCRALDMSLDDARALLAARDAPDADCDTVTRLLDAHIGHVNQRIRELRALERQRSLRPETAPRTVRHPGRACA